MKAALKTAGSRKIEMSRCIAAWMAGLALLGGVSLSQGEPVVAALFSDGMVLQRDVPVPVWGRGEAGEAVAVSFAGQEKTGRCDDSGNWEVKLDPMAAATRGDLVIRGHASQTVHDVVVGDVWICSGQSNMALTLARVAAARPQDFPSIDYPLVRTLRVVDKGALEPQAEIMGKWYAANAANANSFSAVAFLFGRDIHEATKIPIGLINPSYGGSAIEAWLSDRALATDPELAAVEKFQIERYKRFDADIAKYLETIRAWEEKNGIDDPGVAPGEDPSAAPPADLADWKSAPSAASWAALGAKGPVLAWARREFTVDDPAVLRNGFRLDLARWPQSKVEVYLNGHALAPVAADAPFTNAGRSFVVPGAALKSGVNVVALRVLTLVPAAAVNLKTSTMNLPGTAEELAAPWRIKFAREYPPVAGVLPGPPGASYANTATMLYNQMIAPLQHFPIRGFIWYQGESNADGTFPYARYLTLLIRSWRDDWGNADLPFYIVQLPRFHPAVPQPAPSAWALLREEQLKAFQQTKGTGLAVAIDLGEPGNIHPLDKAPVGERLARWALADLYGQPGEVCGPLFVEQTVKGGAIRLKFSHITGGLAANPPGPLRQFAIAGADRKFVWADAAIEGDEVVVQSPSVPEPVAVRYAWADNPEGCNLGNGKGLPASPFRTDSWPDAGK